MTDLAIQVENLGKLYRIGRAQRRHDTLRDALQAAVRTPLERLQGKRAAEQEDTIWALRDISFEVKRGEVIGVIGRNGAGKSTLLKILSRITEPTEGRIVLNGRVGSLLEVGTGFHPELTGRENIYLNGAILGMKRAEITRRFDEIVAFAEIDKFLDTPVKHYSSGMYVRLAFAVAAHLEPEILLVDEVLAVGDAAFQKKCLGKMGEVAGKGRTVVFVSHNMGAIAQLCPTSIVLQAGHIRMQGDSARAIKEYLGSGSADITDLWLDPQRAPQAAMLLTRSWITDEHYSPLAQANTNQEFYLGLQVLVREEVRGIEISVRISNSLGQPLFTTNVSDALQSHLSLVPGSYAFLIRVPSNFLAPDVYSLSVGIHRPNVEILDNLESFFNFRVEESGSRMWLYQGKAYGNILVNLPWKLLAHTPQPLER